MVGIKDIAKKANLSPATVSYALRDSPKIPEATRQEVRRVAAALGYRPNPRVAGLMSHIRRLRSPGQGERIAFVWVHTPKQESRTDAFLRTVFRGAKTRAEQLGYSVEEFWITEAGRSERRLSDILEARGVVGVVFSPVMHEVTVKLDFNWSAFSCAVIGHAEWEPELHHSGHFHYSAMRLALRELQRLGYRRPAVILDEETNQRGRRGWQGAFLVYHPGADAAPDLILRGFPDSPAELKRWLKRVKADAVILHASEAVRRFQSWVPADSSPKVCALRWSEDLAGVCGIDNRFDLVAANAIDLVVSQLISNERGVPDLHRITLFTGQWIEASALPPPVPGM